MSLQTLDILDRSLTCSMWVFLFSFLVCLIFVAMRLRTRKLGLADYFSKEFDKRLEREIAGHDPLQSPAAHVPLSDRLRMAANALLVSVLMAFVSFVAVGFTPLSFFDNFATTVVRVEAPLRLTMLNYERFYEGFSLQGELWNQSDEAIPGLVAAIQIWKTDREPLARISVTVEPDPVPAQSVGKFSFRYTEQSPFLHGYQVSFESKDGLEIPHIKGFDEH